MKYLALTVALSAFACKAQDFVDLANIYFRNSPQNSIDSSSEQLNFNILNFDCKIPVPLGENNVVLGGFEYHSHNFRINEGDKINDNLISYTIQTGWEHKWNPEFKSLFMVINRFNSNFKEQGGFINHQIGGLIFNTVKKSDKLTWKYGLYYNGEFFGPMFVPLFGLNWTINEKWKLKFTIPVDLELSCKAKNWFRYGLRFEGVNGSYMLSGINENFYIDRADNNVWLFSDFYITKNIVFHLRGGYSVLRKYRVFGESNTMDLKLGPVNIGDDRPYSPVWFKNGWSFESRLIFRLPLD